MFQQHSNGAGDSGRGERGKRVEATESKDFGGPRGVSQTRGILGEAPCTVFNGMIDFANFIWKLLIACCFVSIVCILCMFQAATYLCLAYLGMNPKLQVISQSMPRSCQ